MKKVALAVCLLAFVAGLNPLIYRPVPCGQEPTAVQTACEFVYFFTQSLFGFILLSALREKAGRRVVLPGLVLLGAKMSMEIFPLFGLPVNGYVASAFFFTVFAYVLILILRWETFRRK